MGDMGEYFRFYREIKKKEHDERVAKTPDRIKYAIQQFENSGIRYKLKNPETGQSLTANILCKPTNEETIKAYEENGVDLAALPKCTEFSVTSGGYEGLWTSLFVKPLAFIILFIMKFVKSVLLIQVILLVMKQLKR